MRVVERSAIVTQTPAQMFALVDDVAKYPEFLPWCVGARVRESSPTERIAALDIAKGSLKMHFTTKNTLRPGSQILMELIEGPFSRLTGKWNFDPIGERGSRVLFKVEFEFKNKLMAIAMNPVFESVCDKIVDAFVQRAQTTYR